MTEPEKKCSCEHKHTTYDSEAYELTCNDCGEELAGRCEKCNWIMIDRCGLCHSCLQKEALAAQKAEHEAEKKQMIDKMMEIPLRHISLKCKCWQSRDCAAVIAIELLDDVKKKFGVA